MSEKEVNFCGEPITPEERKLYDDILEAMEKEKKASSIVVPKRLNEFFCAYRTLKSIFADEDVEVKVNFAEFKSGLGGIDVIADIINFKDVRDFLDILFDSTKVGIYPLKNGKVLMEFGFWGMTKVIEGLDHI